MLSFNTKFDAFFYFHELEILFDKKYIFRKYDVFNLIIYNYIIRIYELFIVITD